MPSVVHSLPKINNTSAYVPLVQASLGLHVNKRRDCENKKATISDCLHICRPNDFIIEPFEEKFKQIYEFLRLSTPIP
jgi:hypothetical protein